MTSSLSRDNRQATINVPAADPSKTADTHQNHPHPQPQSSNAFNNNACSISKTVQTFAPHFQWWFLRVADFLGFLWTMSTCKSESNSTSITLYLKSLLSGDIARTVAGFAITRGNYQRDNRFVVRMFYMHALLQLPAPCNSLMGLQSCYDNLESNICDLEAFGESQEK